MLTKTVHHIKIRINVYLENGACIYQVLILEIIYLHIYLELFCFFSLKYGFISVSQNVQTGKLMLETSFSD